MKRHPLLGLLASIHCLVATGATAGTLTAATWTQVTQGFPMTRTGAQLGITGGSTGNASIVVGLSYPAFATKFFIPHTANGILDLAVSITQGGPQMITATPGGAGATMGVPGTVRVNTAIHNTKGVNQSTFMTGVNTLVQVPISVGIGGQVTGAFLHFGLDHFITVDFYAWTPGARVFSGLTTKSFSLPTTVTAAGSWNLTAGGGGTVTLVSPSKISIDGPFLQRRTVGLTTLKMYFVPEPSTLLLLGAGAVALVLVSIRKS